MQIEYYQTEQEAVYPKRKLATPSTLKAYTVDGLVFLFEADPRIAIRLGRLIRRVWPAFRRA